MSAQPPVRIALIGAGIFARDAHVPAILALGDAFHVVAVASRSGTSAEKIAAMLPYPVEATDNVEALYARDDIEAINLLLPVQEMEAATEAALRSGKHVVSEKPIATRSEEARRLIAIPRKGIWMVAENWRYEGFILSAVGLIQEGRIGRPVFFNWALYPEVSPGNKYYATPWRRAGSYQGGFLLDGGVHHIAGLRMLLGEVASVSAITAAIRPDLPPVDTQCVAFAFENGAVGTFAASYAVGVPWDTTLDITGTEGTLRIGRGGVTLVRGGETTETPAPRDGIEAELEDFARAIRQGSV
jgi:predicted dehydrogenase